jgi:uncharacterized protein with HEPN domain
MSDRDNSFLVEDMLEAAQKIQSYTRGFSFEDFLKDERTMDAVVRNFEIIGEAASRVTPDFKQQNPSIPWHKLKGYRNRLIHEYFGVDYQIVWEVIESDLSQLINILVHLGSRK